ncbi:MAG: sodium:solute symporter family transporter, partial [Lachnospiraceae bacterium]
MSVAILIGVIGNAMSSAGVIETFADTSASETVIVKIAALMSENGILLAIVAGIILAGILAATMSTADSQLLAASSSVSENIMKGVFKLKISEKATMIIARATVVVVSIIAAFLASDPNSSVFNIVSFSWAGFGAAFGPVVLFSLFWKRTNKWGALAGMLSGGAMVFIWEYVSH